MGVDCSGYPPHCRSDSLWELLKNNENDNQSHLTLLKYAKQSDNILKSVLLWQYAYKIRRLFI